MTEETQAPEEQKTPETAVISDEKKVYELAYHLSSVLDDEKRAGAVDATRKSIEDRGGMIINDVYPELLDLAYTMERSVNAKMQKFDTAYFGWINFEMDIDKVEDVLADTRKNETIIRHLLTITTKELAMQPRPMFKTHAEPSTEAHVPEKPVEKVEEKKPMNEGEVDKAIDELVSDEVAA